VISLDEIKQAQEAISKLARCTPLEYSTSLTNLTGNEIYLKAENLQKTGSFKIRGAYNKIRLLSPEERKKGVLAASAGNHAQGVAYAASFAGIKSTIVMPETAPLTKISATKSYGAEVVLHGENYDDAYQKADEIRAETGQIFIHAFNDPAVISGQGTLGLEIFAQLPDVDVVLAPIGGGGLIAGTALALKELNPRIKLIGVQAAGAPAMYLSKQLDKLHYLKSVSTIADGIAIKRPGDLTFEIIRRYVDDILTVDDEEISSAILFLLERAKLVVEGAGAVGVAALIHGKLAVRGKKIAVVLSGGNIDVNIVSRIIERGLVKTGRSVRLVTSIPDRPGELRKLLQLVAEAKANVIGVYHERVEPQVPLGKAKVELRLETKNKQHAEGIVYFLAKEGYQVQLI
jgi:threonine dehydratase